MTVMEVNDFDDVEGWNGDLRGEGGWFVCMCVCVCIFR